MSKRALQCALGVALLVASSAAWAGMDQSKKPADAYPSDVASAWFDTLYDVVKTEKTTPPPASRIYGIASVALDGEATRCATSAAHLTARSAYPS